MSSQTRDGVIKTLFMATRQLKEMPLSELLRIAETQKGKAYLLGEAKIMTGLINQIYAVVGEPSPPEPPPVAVPSARKRAKKAPRSQKIEPQNFDGTLKSLGDCYRTYEQSPFHKLRHKTRVHYDFLISRIVDRYGHEKLAEWKAQEIKRVYEDWAERGKVSTGHATVTVLRILINFGARVLENSECQRLSGIFNAMHFITAKPRGERLTAEQARAIINKAHEKGRHSIALAQAFQFDCALGQRDVIGEWVPHGEAGVSEITHGNQKWLRGLRWSEIDKDLVLRHVGSRDGKLVEIPLSQAPMVIAEFASLGDKLPLNGPIIVNEDTDRPYHGDQFRLKWREIATAVGVPQKVKNMDSIARRAANESGRKESTLTARLVGSNEPR